MSDTRDELVDVIAEAVGVHPATGHMWAEDCHEVALAVLAALVERYGEPEIYDTGEFDSTIHERRLVFPWQAVKEAGE